MEKGPGEKINQEAGPLGRPLHAPGILDAGPQAFKRVGPPNTIKPASCQENYFYFNLASGRLWVIYTAGPWQVNTC
jgi:hypothetical protein